LMREFSMSNKDIEARASLIRLFLGELLLISVASALPDIWFYPVDIEWSIGRRAHTSS
jgi:hypothetical protein